MNDYCFCCGEDLINGVSDLSFQKHGMSTMSDIKELYEKMSKGDPLTDKELAQYFDFFDDLTNKLLKAGPAFHIAFLHAHKQRQDAEDYIYARATNRNRNKS